METDSPSPRPWSDVGAESASHQTSRESAPSLPPALSHFLLLKKIKFETKKHCRYTRNLLCDSRRSHSFACLFINNEHEFYVHPLCLCFNIVTTYSRRAYKQCRPCFIKCAQTVMYLPLALLVGVASVVHPTEALPIEFNHFNFWIARLSRP